MSQEDTTTRRESHEDRAAGTGIVNGRVRLIEDTFVIFVLRAFVA
jgi:hypothetical protein